jgi:hypothetical protein
MEWGPYVGPTPLYLDVVSLLYSVSILIISLKENKRKREKKEKKKTSHSLGSGEIK